MTQPTSTTPPCNCGCTQPCGIRIALINGQYWQDLYYGWYYCPVNEYSYWEVILAGFQPPLDHWNGNWNIGLGPGSYFYGASQQLAFECSMAFVGNKFLDLAVAGGDGSAGIAANGLLVLLNDGINPGGIGYYWSGNLCNVQPDTMLTLNLASPDPNLPPTITVIPRGPTCACCPRGLYNGQMLTQVWPTLTATLMNGTGGCQSLNGLQIPLTFQTTTQIPWGGGSSVNPAAYLGITTVDASRCPLGASQLAFYLQCVKAPAVPDSSFLTPTNDGWAGGFASTLTSSSGDHYAYAAPPVSYRCDPMAPMWTFQGVEVIGLGNVNLVRCCGTSGNGHVDVVVTSP